MDQQQNQIDANRRRRGAARRERFIADARKLLEAIVAEKIDVWEGYRRVYSLYTRSSGLLSELKPLFRTPSVNPDGSVRVTQELGDAIRNLSARWLLGHPA